MDTIIPFEFSAQTLKACTKNFNQSNLIGLTRFGRLYRGCLADHAVTVKIYDTEKLERISSKYNDEYFIIKEEIKFWTNPALKGCPNLVTLFGYTWERDIKGVVYDLHARDTLENLMKKDSLCWFDTVNIIHEMVKFLKFIHDQEKQNMVLNINTSHILLDWDYKPLLFDLLLPSEVKTQKEQLTISTSYMDPYFSLKGRELDNKSFDVFSFGIVLLELLTNRISDIEKREDGSLNLDSLVHIWAKKEYKPNCSLVHKNVQKDWFYYDGDGVAMTLLGMQCIGYFPENHPSMSDVLHILENHPVLQHCSFDATLKMFLNNIECPT